MPVYPETSSHLNNFTRADGTVSLHSDDHARIIDLVVNAKHYLKGDGTTETQGNIDAFAAACAAKVGFLPPGTYAWPDGGSLTMLQSTTLRGAGRRATFITCKNAYAIKATSVDTLAVEGFGFTVRSAATTGGGIKWDSTAASFIRDCEVSSVSTSTEPGIWLKGAVKDHITYCNVQGMTAHGIKLDATGGTVAFNNANSVYNCRVNSVQGSTNAGIYSESWGGNRFRDNIIESNRGYGLYCAGSAHDTIEGNWFEDNSNHDLFLATPISQQVIGNKFHGMHGDIGTADHINVTSTANQRNLITIAGNLFQDPSSSGVAIRNGTDVYGTTIAGNRGAGLLPGSIVDNGIYSTIIGNDGAGANADSVKIPGAISPPLYVLAGTPAAGAVAFQTANAAGTNYFQVGTRGIAWQRTGDISLITGSDELPTNAFAFYWDEAAGKIKARVRNNSGAYSTLDVTP